MSNDFLFISGWAGYPELFPSLHGKGEFLLPFVDHSEREIFDALETSTASTLIGWSTGAHMILKRWPRVIHRFERIILMAPFLSFTDYTPEKVVKLMMRGMRRNPVDVIAQFLKNCGYRKPLDFNDAHAAALTEGLEYLLTSRAMPVSRGAEKVTLVHGEHDRIVSPTASEDIWATMSKAAYHALPCGHWIPDHEVAEIAFQG